jgi:hypothetical protein
MRILNLCAQILRITKMWPPQSNKRFILQNKSIFVLDIFIRISRGRGNVFLHLIWFLTSYRLLEETIQYSYNLSSPPNPKKAVSLYAQMNMSLHIHIVAPFRDGLISLVDTLSGRMIGLMVSLSNMISSLPPIFMNFIS